MNKISKICMPRFMIIAMLVVWSCLLAFLFAPGGSIAAPQAAEATSSATVHKALLNKMKKLPAWGGELVYTFMNVDGDKADEALCQYRYSGGSGREFCIFDYKNGAARCIYDTQEYGLSWVKYYKKTKSLVVWGAGHGGEWYSYLKLKGGKYVGVAYRARASVKGGSFQNGTWGYYNSAADEDFSRAAFKRAVSKLQRGSYVKTSITNWKSI